LGFDDSRKEEIMSKKQKRALFKSKADEARID
jgi:hypothetical protein